ncbi:hypothetical protein HYE82_15870 [Streptomyces sp. BR123]|uniref:hypothetical protein n=1 Tax=Streptomyces sp. BR123 TaxID=2749828 RepID=UPI0015C4D3D2|nr:hypothetical protein [Streptomyces sp. BR123]NXY95843.1 hypothetical protein [Streptomyces sp. BR123]
MSTVPASDPQSANAEPSSPAGAESPADPQAGSAAPRKPRPRLVFDDPLDQQSRDDTDHGWGERAPATGSSADLARFLDEKPPHHL